MRMHSFTNIPFERVELNENKAKIASHSLEVFVNFDVDSKHSSNEPNIRESIVESVSSNNVQSDDLEDEAYDRGYEKGFVEATEKMNQQISMMEDQFVQLQTKIDSLTESNNLLEVENKNLINEKEDLAFKVEETMKNIVETRDQYVADMQEEMKDFILSSCETILKTKLDEDEIVLSLLEEALDSVKNSENVVVRYNPNSMINSPEYNDKIKNIMGELNMSAMMVEDLTIDEHGFKITSDETEIDSQLSTKLEKLNLILEGE